MEANGSRVELSSMRFFLFGRMASFFAGTCWVDCPQSIIDRVVEKGSDDLTTEGYP